MFKRSRHFKKSSTAVSLVVVLFTLNACSTVGPDYRQATTPKLPSNWTATGDAEQLAQSEASIRQVTQWWQQFNDPTLNQLIDRGARQNLSIEAAGLRIVQARAALGISDSLNLPQQQQVNGTWARSYTQEKSYNAASLSLDMGWEMDIWGKYARGIESAEATLYAGIASYHDVLVSITAEIARNYINYRTAQERYFLSKQNIAIQQRVLDMTEVQFESGNVSELDVQQARTQLYTTESSLPSFDIARMQARNALAVLLGTRPEDIRPLLRLNDDRAVPDFDSDVIQISKSYSSQQDYIAESLIPAAPEPATQVDSRLILQRPDLQVAELQARAQNAKIGQAQAELYPSFFLFGSVGMSQTVAKGDSFSASEAVNAVIGPGIQWNIFQYGRIKNNVRIQDAGLQLAINNYNATVLRAVQEVSSALESYNYTQQKSDFDFKALDASIRAFNISANQYNNGLVTYQRLLSTVEKLTRREDVYATTRGNLANQVVTIYKALGGGWQSYGDLPLVKPETVEQMKERSDWGDYLDTEIITGADRNE